MIKPYAVYVFQKMPEKATRYLHVEHWGGDVQAFPAVWKLGVNKGREYIVLRETADNKLAGSRAYCLSGEGNRMFTGLNFTADNPYKAYGDYAGHAMLIEVSGETIITTFFSGMKLQAKSLFEAWTAGTLTGEGEAKKTPPAAA
jgi:hypothetical protein